MARAAPCVRGAAQFARTTGCLTRCVGKRVAVTRRARCVSPRGIVECAFVASDAVLFPLLVLVLARIARGTHALDARHRLKMARGTLNAIKGVSRLLVENGAVSDHAWLAERAAYGAIGELPLGTPQAVVFLVVLVLIGVLTPKPVVGVDGTRDAGRHA